MRLSREEFREHLVDYLYGQLGASERASFEACLEESADCRQELAELQKTLEHARAGLASLEDAPPARARARILAHAAAQEPPTPALTRFFAWLSSPAPLGALSVVAVAALGLLVHQSRREVTQPERDVSQPERGAPSAPAREPNVAPIEQLPASPEMQPTTGAGDASPARRPAAPAKGAAASDSPRGAASGSVRSTAPSRRPATAEYEAPEADQAPAEPAATASPVARAPATPTPARAPATPTPARATAPARELAPAATATARATGAPAVDGLGPRSPADDVSRAHKPAPALGAGAPRTAPTPPSAAEAGDLELRAAPAAAPSAPGSSPASGQSQGRARKMEATTRDEVSVERPPAPSAAARQATPEALEREADADFAAQRWREAAQTYEKLLSRFPKHTRATRWQKQLTLAQRALRETKPAP